MLGLCQTGSSTDKHLELDLSNEEGISTDRKLPEVDILFFWQNYFIQCSRFNFREGLIDVVTPIFVFRFVIFLRNWKFDSKTLFESSSDNSEILLLNPSSDHFYQVRQHLNYMRDEFLFHLESIRFRE